MTPELLATSVVTVSVVIWANLWVRHERSKDKVKSVTKVIDMLTIGLGMEVIDARVANRLLNIWWHVDNAGGSVQCACGAVYLHCEDDEAEYNGFKHTPKFCDVAEEA